jgi:hypothetical protein
MPRAHDHEVGVRLRERFGPVLGSVLEYLLTLLQLVAMVLFGWIRGLIELCRRRRDSRRAHDERKRTGRDLEDCVRIPPVLYRQPDPLIYSQGYLMALKLAVTWDNPDVTLLREGKPVAAHELAPDTEYEVVARIWNGSTNAPAVGMPVRCSYLSFGIGTVSKPIGETLVDLPVRGAPQHPAHARFNWRTPALPGHYCLRVELVWPDDANPHNNLGQHNTAVCPLNSPTARFAFPVRNDAPRARTLRLEVDAYQLPRRPRCSAKPAPRDPRPDVRLRTRVAEARNRHGRDRFPIPDGWRVELSAQELALAPGEEQVVTAVVTAPEEHFTGVQAFNVNAFDGDELIGGVTLRARG